MDCICRVYWKRSCVLADRTGLQIFSGGRMSLRGDARGCDGGVRQELAEELGTADEGRSSGTLTLAWAAILVVVGAVMALLS